MVVDHGLVGYVSEPDGRGTSSLVLSCLLTLILCVWQALHLNVPEKGQSNLKCVLENVRWIIAGIYAPELVVFTAWRQWSSARLLRHLVDSLQHNADDTDERESVSILRRSSMVGSFRWSRTHDFFASTGGFALDVKDRHRSIFPNSDRLTLTARGVALLARCDHLPRVSEEEVLDKSKANGLAKALVMFQALWMLLQVLGRLLANLPVTLLEVNTVAHVCCAICMYVMWWNKPLLAKEPVMLDLDDLEPLAAFMYMSSEMSGFADPKSLRSGTVVKTLFASLNLYSKTPEIERLAYRFDEDHTSVNTDADHSPEGGRLRPIAEPCRHLVQDVKNTKVADTAFFERRPRVRAMTDLEKSTVPEEALQRWHLANLAIHKYPAILEHQRLLSHNGCVHFKSEQLLAGRVQNWPGDDLLRNVGGLMVGMILWLSNFAYGGIHAAAWNEHFPSTAERWLWRTSSLYISFCGGLWIILNYIAHAYRPLNDFWEKWMDGSKAVFWNIMLGTLVVLCGGTLCVARAYIVIEAFISIREVPAAAYETPRWTQILPHF